MRANVDAGRTALAVVTTSGEDNRTVVFVDRIGDKQLPPSDDSRPIDYRRAKIDRAHVLASAAIPVIFPPVQVPNLDGSVGGWYIDGGVRLNTPEAGARSECGCGADRRDPPGARRDHRHPAPWPAHLPTSTTRWFE
jgi:Patatin-like phospholipase